MSDLTNTARECGVPEDALKEFEEGLEKDAQGLLADYVKTLSEREGKEKPKNYLPKS